MMRELDDNTRTGLHYLLLGIAVIAALVVAGLVLDRLYPGMGPGGSFGHGYLLDQERGPALIGSVTTRGERIMTVMFLAFAVATVVAGGAWLLLRRALPRIKPLAIATWWVVFLSILVGGGRAALFEPPLEWVGQRDGALIIWRRTVLLNDIPLPKSRVIDLVPFTQVQEVAVVTEALRADRKRVRVELRLKDGGTRTLGVSEAVSVGDSAVTIFAEERARLVRLILRGNAH